jgi:CRISPR-associated protein Cas6
MTTADRDDALPMARMVDLAFELTGRTIARDYGRDLGAAVAAALPWIESTPAAGLHRLNTSTGGTADALLLSGRTRLTLRIPRERVGDAQVLTGQCLDMHGVELRVGPARTKELLPWGTLYAPIVAAPRTADSVDDERAFMRHVEDELGRLDVTCRTICGRAHRGDDGRLHGWSVMLDQLTRDSALRVLESGVGAHRMQGCGLFVPHKSAAAVGTPPG